VGSWLPCCWCRLVSCLVGVLQLTEQSPYKVDGVVRACCQGSSVWDVHRGTGCDGHLWSRSSGRQNRYYSRDHKDYGTICAPVTHPTLAFDSPLCYMPLLYEIVCRLPEALLRIAFHLIVSVTFSETVVASQHGLSSEDNVSVGLS